MLRSKAEIKFTYKKLVNGLKNGKFKKICVVTGGGISAICGMPYYN